MGVLKAERVRVIDAAGAATAASRAAEAQAAEHRADVDAAYQAGLVEGRRQAEADGIASVPRLADTVGKAAASVWEAVSRRKAEETEVVLATALEVARWIVGRELSSSPELLGERIEAALADLLPTGRLTLFVSPSQVDAINEWLADTARDADVVADRTVSPGEARLEAGDASADLTFDTALARAREALR